MSSSSHNACLQMLEYIDEALGSSLVFVPCYQTRGRRSTGHIQWARDRARRAQIGRPALRITHEPPRGPAVVADSDHQNHHRDLIDQAQICRPSQENRMTCLRRGHCCIKGIHAQSVMPNSQDDQHSHNSLQCPQRRTTPTLSRR